MLNLYLGFEKMKDKLMLSLDRNFGNIYEDEWMFNPLAKEIIKEIDNSDLYPPHNVVSPELGSIPVGWISGGAKTLITMLYRTDILYSTIQLGDNCYPMLERITKDHDINMVAGHLATFTDTHEVYFPQYDIYVVGNDEILQVILNHTRDFRS